MFGGLALARLRPDSMYRHKFLAQRHLMTKKTSFLPECYSNIYTHIYKDNADSIAMAQITGGPHAHPLHAYVLQWFLQSGGHFLADSLLNEPQHWVSERRDQADRNQRDGANNDPGPDVVCCLLCRHRWPELLELFAQIRVVSKQQL